MQAIEERDGNVDATASVLDGVEFVGIEPDLLTAEFRTDALMSACAFLGMMRQQPRSDVEVRTREAASARLTGALTPRSSSCNTSGRITR